jgi:hypothetical protein
VHHLYDYQSSLAFKKKLTEELRNRASNSTQQINSTFTPTTHAETSPPKKKQKKKSALSVISLSCLCVCVESNVCIGAWIKCVRVFFFSRQHLR